MKPFQFLTSDASKFAPGTSIAAAYDINTPEGRRRRFNEKIDALTKLKSEGGKGMSLDDALFEMRGNKEDRLLLGAMGYGFYDQAHQKLHDRMSHISTVDKLGAGSEDFDLKTLKKISENASADGAREAASRTIAFNCRIDQLTRAGFTVDQAIIQMRADPKDAALLAAMDGPSA